MILVDTNLAIYIAQGKLVEKHFKRHSINFSVISMIEALGYYLMPVEELRALEQVFNASHIVPLSDQVANEAVRVRQIRKIRLGDSIIAATALVNDLELWTNNIKDFKRIPGLKLYNPLKP